MDCLPEMQPSVSVNNGIGLHSRVRYIVGKDENGDDADDSHFNYNKYGFFPDNLNRGGPGDTVCEWVVYSYVMFNEVVNYCCRKSLCRILAIISNLYDLQIKDTYFPRFANMLFSFQQLSYCSLFYSKATQEPRQKILKLGNN